MAEATTQPRPQAVAAPAAARIEALDWTKGALLVFMVIYHAINYSAYRPIAFRFLAFLPSSFILITGFLVGQVYATKYDLGSGRPYLRLAIRGLKLGLIFAVLNLGRCVGRAHGLVDGFFDFSERAPAIFLSGNGRVGIFEVLLPIAYFLLAAPALLWVRARYSWGIVGGAVAVFGLCVGVELSGYTSKNMELVSVGVIGMAIGMVPLSRIDRVAGNWWVVLGAYALYRLASYRVGEIYPVQVFGSIASLLVLYAAALSLGTEAWANRELVFSGKYSLLGYLVQIAVLQVVVFGMGGSPNRWIGVIVSCAVTTAILFALLHATQTLRRRSGVFDRSYRAIFA